MAGPRAYHATQVAVNPDNPAKEISKNAWNADLTLVNIAGLDIANTWALAQTFTVAPVFTQQANTRTALGLGTLATQSGTFSGTSSGTNTGDQTSIVGITGSLAEFNTALTGADFATGGGTVTGASSGTNTGDQTSIVGITGTKAQFDTACTDGNFAYQTDLTATAVGLGSVTNDAQTKAAIVPNTAPAAGEILVGNAGGTAYAPVALSGDATLASTGAISLAKPLLFAAVGATPVALANSSATQNIFDAANDTLTVEASTSYLFEALIRTTEGGTAHTVSFGFGGTATLTSIAYEGKGSRISGSGLSTNVNYRWVVSAAQTTLTSAGTLTGTNLFIKGIVRINGAGTLIPQMAFSVDPTGTCQVETNSYITLRKLGSDTVLSSGPWA